MDKLTKLSFFLIIVSFLNCDTTPKKTEKLKPVIQDKPKATVANSIDEKKDLAFLESIEDGRNLPSSGKWKEDQYAEFTEQTFPSYPPAREVIDFKTIDYPLLNAAVFYATSKERRKLGMKPYRYSELCEQAAFAHAQDMVNLNFYSHTSKVSGKETIKDRLELVGIMNAVAGENIINSFAIDYKAGTPVYTPEQNVSKQFSYQKNGPPIPNHTYLSLAESLVSAWMNSPNHRRNILNPEFSYLGTGNFHFKDATFHGIDKVKGVQVFSSKP
jgi:uncharacterized protein YkwD